MSELARKVYDDLAKPFDYTFTDVRGGVEVTFVSGEQVASRLNETLGVDGWSFRVLEHEIHPEADEAWALGEITAVIDGHDVVRQQFGSQKIKRSRSTGTPLDLGFDLKGAGTDAMKKCASLLGVALYLSAKKPQPQQQRPAQRPRPAPAEAAARPAAKPTPITIKCKYVLNEDGEICDKALEPVRDGEREWSAVDLANDGQKRFHKPYCWDHYCEALATTEQTKAS